MDCFGIGGKLENREIRRITKLFHALGEGNVQKLEKYHRIYGMNMAIRDEVKFSEGSTVLHHACRGGHFRLVEYLLVNVAMDVNSQNMRGETPMHEVCLNGTPNLVHLLLHHGSNPNYGNQRGETPLHYACRNGKLKIISALLTSMIHRIDINQQAKDGSTPLMWAMKSLSVSVVNGLINIGANINLANHNGETALHWACAHGTQEVVLILLNAGAAMTLTNDGNSPLHVARDLITAQILIARGADITQRNQAGKTCEECAQYALLS